MAWPVWHWRGTPWVVGGGQALLVWFAASFGTVQIFDLVGVAIGTVVFAIAQSSALLASARGARRLGAAYALMGGIGALTLESQFVYECHGFCWHSIAAFAVWGAVVLAGAAPALLVPPQSTRRGSLAPALTAGYVLASYAFFAVPFMSIALATGDDSLANAIDDAIITWGTSMYVFIYAPFAVAAAVAAHRRFAENEIGAGFRHACVWGWLGVAMPASIIFLFLGGAVGAAVAVLVTAITAPAWLGGAALLVATRAWTIRMLGPTPGASAAP